MEIPKLSTWQSIRIRNAFCILSICTLMAGGISADLPLKKERQIRQVALSKLNALIGGWRGVGRPQRSTAAGAWTEKAEWVWAFGKDGPTLQLHVKDGKKLRDAELSWDVKSNQYHMIANSLDDTQLHLSGKIDGKQLVLDSKPDAGSDDVHRLTITMLNPKRTLFSLQQQRSGRGPFQRLYEVGYTRRGTRLAKNVVDGPECIVTGGLGTIAVQHAGETYYVCCTGCRQAFEEDPSETLRQYEASKANIETEPSVITD